MFLSWHAWRQAGQQPPAAPACQNLSWEHITVGRERQDSDHYTQRAIPTPSGSDGHGRGGSESGTDKSDELQEIRRVTYVETGLGTAGRKLHDVIQAMCDEGGENYEEH
ncbi:hypothetical protein DFH06DRAFT_1134967 [Mycena polygramma]|nr:hypothetical protein DFH06DRAFT_1134967 [Mycena polygramma]